MKRRSFLAAAALPAANGGAAVRAKFPIAGRQTYLNAAGLHPISTASARAMEDYIAFRLHGRGVAYSEQTTQDVRALYARLIHAEPDEIAIVPGTQAGENLVALGLGLHRGQGNVVTDELHFHGSLYLYRSLEQFGLEVRIVKQREWRIAMGDVERAVDRNTKLIAVSHVSNINGFVHDAKALSELAHAHGAYLYLDAIQSVGCMPFDVRALGVDFCCAGTYKWLMGVSGMGYLFVRRELQQRVLAQMQFGDRQYGAFAYHNLPGSPAGAGPFSWDSLANARRYEIGHMPEIAIACQREALRFLLDAGPEAVTAHTRPLVQRIRKEVAALGYPAITPEESSAPIAAFLAGRPAETEKRLAAANVAAKVKWGQLRVSPAVFNTAKDVDRLLEALD